MTTAPRNILPWVVWGAAILAYLIAVINRSSLAALGPTTQEHFGIDATTLSMFAVIQLIVYAALQIPVGVLLDRFGPSVIITAGGILMLLGQVAMATVHEVSLAILARVLVGAGDACTFICAIRMMPAWFSEKLLPTIVQVTSLVGQMGQLIAVTPFAILIGWAGWSTGFLGIAAAGLAVTLFGMFTMRDHPGRGTIIEQMTGRLGQTSRDARAFGVQPVAEAPAPAPSDTSSASGEQTAPDAELAEGSAPPSAAGKARASGAELWRNGRLLLAIPGVRLAFWLHFSGMFAMNVFVLLWGTPFLVGGVGLSITEARLLLSIAVVTIMVGGVLMGPLTSRYAKHRVMINVWVTALIMIVWLVVLLSPGVPPFWLLVVLMIVMAVGSPASMIAFEVVHTHAPRHLAGFATGIANMGGFISTLGVIFFIGLILDLLGAGSPDSYSLAAFRWAFAAQIPFWLVAIGMILIETRRTERWMRDQGRSLR